ncbi:MAG: hypothetical protein EOQ52_20535 [Mesorhizobium sp.]|uniref:hypothetical protein n=1 Tax=Mesorhizobium sp. TaxID=1871066 RepID=UPI000FE7C2E9|nr:hypothetical protein [Mesorhizobium sp.]RWB85939.1 MAG: hypothetical protein EOQ52_20535 [Mesorhizobium sp.]
MNAPLQSQDGLSPDASHLKAVRAAYAAIAPADWSRAQDENGPLIEARSGSGERFVLARFEPAASIAEVIFMADAADHVRFLLRLLDDAFAAIREIRAGQAFDDSKNNPAAGPAQAHDPKNFAAECAMKCQDPAFKVFLEERHGLERPLTDDRVAQRVRSILGVQSRNELNDGGQAAGAWKALRADFAAWLKVNR